MDGGRPADAGPAAGEDRHRSGGVPVRVAGASPHRVGKPLKLALEGAHSAHRGDYPVIYRIDDHRCKVSEIIYRPFNLRVHSGRR